MAGPRTSPTQRKGTIIPQSKLDGSAQQKLSGMRNTHGNVTELREYTNGSIGAFFVNGQFRFIKGNIKGRQPGEKIQYRALSRNAAERAFQRYYRNSGRYNSKKASRAALTRDRCLANKTQIKDTRYRRSPHRWDYPGVDDGSRCPTNLKKRTKSAMTQKQYNNLVKGNPRIKSPSKQEGGGNQKPVSLKTAVKLLRQYYAEKWSN